MNCPECCAHIDGYEKVCGKCGAKLPAQDVDLVFSVRGSSSSKRRRNKRKKVIAVVVCALFAIALIAVLFVLWKNGGGSDNSTATVSEYVKSQPTTVAQPVPTDVPPAPVQPATADNSADAQKKLEAYIRETNLFESISSFSVNAVSPEHPRVERNKVIIAFYGKYDMEPEDDLDYYNRVKGEFEDVCSSLDKYVDDMKKKTGLPNAHIEVICYGASGSAEFSRQIG